MAGLDDDYADPDEEFEILYVDFTSLYPAVNFDSPYYCGHPTPYKYYDDVNWTTSADVKCPKNGFPFHGFAQVEILPPRDLYLPVRFWGYSFEICIFR